MNLPKAIEILTDYHKRLPRGINDDYLDAIKLGIEALEAYQKAQDAGWYPPGYKLPSETEE